MVIPRYPLNSQSPVVLYSPEVMEVKRQIIIFWLNQTPNLEQGLSNKTIMKISEVYFAPDDFAELVWSTEGLMLCLANIFSDANQYIIEPNMDVRTFELLMEALTIFEWVALDIRTKISLVCSPFLHSLYPFLMTNYNLPFYCCIKNRILTMFNMILMTPFNIIIHFCIDSGFMDTVALNMASYRRDTTIICVNIMFRFLRHPKALNFVCSTSITLTRIVGALNDTINGMELHYPDFKDAIVLEPLHNIIMCYALISTNIFGRYFLKKYLPEALRAFTFYTYLSKNPATLDLLVRLLENFDTLPIA
ncbi:unnamed protein product [Brassicogethes aeneus]|uniref:CCR4-NOT transcription complex subunit 9 n=1 Tax=Brassicogethes aeneus TaxID=1431903 RepID=A0A9P0FLY0_BRAAE|nr:unnamed protein product [Brassicogethes aeneus]